MGKLSISLLSALAIASPCLASSTEDGREDRAQASSVCVEVSKEQVPEVLSEMRSRGLKIEEYPDNTCFYWNDRMQGLLVPAGLEHWTVKTLRQLGYTAKHAAATAGGGGENKSRVERSYVFDGDVNPQNYQEVIGNIDCKLKTRFSSYFQDVNIQNKCKSDIDERELCWNIWVGGHLATSKGLRDDDLRKQVPSKYWFSSRIEIFIGDFYDYPEANGAQKARIDFFVLSTRFARSPPDEVPDGSRYQTIDQFEPQLDVDEVDDLVGWAIRQNVVRAGPLECRPGAQ